MASDGGKRTAETDSVKTFLRGAERLSTYGIREVQHLLPHVQVHRQPTPDGQLEADLDVAGLTGAVLRHP